MDTIYPQGQARMSNTQVCILYTGGTIGMKNTPDGYAPERGYLEEQMAVLSQLKNPVLPSYEIEEFDPLLDSSNATPTDWVKIARRIAEKQADYSSFVVLHGTDTMAYTASALAFLLEGLDRPVIVTGSQIPLGEIRSDGVENLITALLIAANYAIPEVCLYFGGKLLRGCRTTKVNASGMDAFASPNYPALGTAGIRIVIHWEAVLPAPPAGTSLNVDEYRGETPKPGQAPSDSDACSTYPTIGVLRLFPGLTAQMVRNFLQPPLDGLVLQTYGVGGGPDRDAELIAAIKKATGNGLVVVACTQCLQGGVSMESYSTSTALVRAGVVSGYDMTTEAALTKLFYLFRLGYKPDEVRKEIAHNLRGELTPS
jgi:L-asparaginase